MTFKSLSQHIPKKTKHRLKPMSANTIKLYNEVERSLSQGEIIKIINNNIQCNEDIEKYLRYSRAKDKAKQLREICELFFKLSKEDIVEVYNNTNPFDYKKKKVNTETGQDVFIIGKEEVANKLMFIINEENFNKTVKRFADPNTEQSTYSLVKEIAVDDFSVRHNKNKWYHVVPKCRKRTCLVTVEKVVMEE